MRLSALPSHSREETDFDKEETMAQDINNFVANWIVWYVDGQSPVLKSAYILAIGTEPGTEPFLGPEGHPCVGFVIYQADRKPIFTSEEYGPLVLVDGSLRWIGTQGTNSILKRIYVSLAESVSEDKKVSFSLY